MNAYSIPAVSPSTVCWHGPFSVATDAGTDAFSANAPSPSRTCTSNPVSSKPPVDVGHFQPIVIAPPSASISTTSGGDGGKLGSGWPYVAYSFFSLNAAAWIGMPVQWNANGKSAFFPCIRSKLTANSAFVIEKAWPMCSRPFMRGRREGDEELAAPRACGR